MENPPAFPAMAFDQYQGMSLRDYFAAAALSHLRVGDWLLCADGAKYCYDYADAMLAAREKEVS